MKLLLFATILLAGCAYHRPEPRTIDMATIEPPAKFYRGKFVCPAGYDIYLDEHEVRNGGIGAHCVASR